jgi:hypothetical protein
LVCERREGNVATATALCEESVPTGTSGRCAESMFFGRIQSYFRIARDTP